MRGEGNIAELVRQQYKKYGKLYGMNEDRWELDTTIFRRPGEQGRLFWTEIKFWGFNRPLKKKYIYNDITMSKASNKKVYRLPNHSLAKIALYKRYLSIYLNILANTSFKTIYLIDLFAGEGRDIDGKACSSIAAIETLRNHYDTSHTVCKRVVIFFNDYGSSVIEKNAKKIERVQRFTEELKLPTQYEVKYSEEKFEIIVDKVIQRLKKLDFSEKALCFFDPWGYKYSKPQTLKEILSNGKTELILFMPICFMHRFAAKALKDEDYIEGQHIEKFINEIYENEIPEIQTQVSFIKGIQKQLKKYLSVEYIDVLFIEKETNQYFALYFFK